MAEEVMIRLSGGDGRPDTAGASSREIKVMVCVFQSVVTKYAIWEVPAGSVQARRLLPRRVPSGPGSCVGAVLDQSVQGRLGSNCQPVALLVLKAISAFRGQPPSSVPTCLVLPSLPRRCRSGPYSRSRRGSAA